MEETQDQELNRIKAILDVMKQLGDLLTPLNEDEYRRMREYINARQQVDLPYSNPFIPKPDRK